MEKVYLIQSPIINYSYKLQRHDYVHREEAFGAKLDFSHRHDRVMYY